VSGPSAGRNGDFALELEMPPESARTGSLLREGALSKAAAVEMIGSAVSSAPV